MKFGLNCSSVHGNNRDLAVGYFFKPDRQDVIISNLWPLLIHAGVSRVRSLAILAERDDVSTRYLHIPLTEQEADLIARFTRNAPIHTNPDGSEYRRISTEISLTNLWEARWGWDEGVITGPVPDNPFKTPGELAEALLLSLQRLIAAKPRKDTIIDIWNEFDLADVQEPVMELYYAPAAELLDAAGLTWTISSIMDSGGSARPIANYHWLEKLGRLPKVLEVHVNAWPISMPGFQLAMSDIWERFQLPCNIGECDVDLNQEGMEALISGMSEGEEIMFWK